MKTRLGRYITGDTKPITSDKPLQVRVDTDGDPLSWCSTPGGHNPDITINIKRDKLVSVFAGDRRVV